LATLQDVDIVSGINAALSVSVVEFVWKPVWVSSATVGGDIGGTNLGGRKSAGGPVESVPTGEGHVERVFTEEVVNVSEENGVDETKVDGAVVSGVSVGAQGGVVGGDGECVLETGDHFNVIVVFSASKKWGFCREIVV